MWSKIKMVCNNIRRINDICLGWILMSHVIFPRSFSHCFSFRLGKFTFGPRKFQPYNVWVVFPDYCDQYGPLCMYCMCVIFSLPGVVSMSTQQEPNVLLLSVLTICLSTCDDINLAWFWYLLREVITFYNSGLSNNVFRGAKREHICRRKHDFFRTKFGKLTEGRDKQMQTAAIFATIGAIRPHSIASEIQCTIWQIAHDILKSSVVFIYGYFHWKQSARNMS